MNQRRVELPWSFLVWTQLAVEGTIKVYNDQFVQVEPWSQSFHPITSNSDFLVYHFQKTSFSGWCRRDFIWEVLLLSRASPLECILPSTKVVAEARNFTNLLSRDTFSVQVQSLVGLTPRGSWWRRFLISSTTLTVPTSIDWILCSFVEPFDSNCPVSSSHLHQQFGKSFFLKKS